MIDHYFYGVCDRISPEAPVPVVRITDEVKKPGGAGNVAANLISLGAYVWVRSAGTSVKKRVVVGHHQMIRLDYDADEEFVLNDNAIDELENCIKRSKLVVMCDYGKGTLTDLLVTFIGDMSEKYNKPVLVEPYVGKSYYGSKIDLIKPNIKAVESVVGHKLTQDNLIESSLHYRELIGAKNMVLTMGPKGMYWFPKGKQAKHYPADEVKVYDVTGAGDTAMAVLAFIWAQPNFSMSSAVYWANKASGLVVQKPGTAVVGFDELFGKYLNVIPWGLNWLEDCAIID